MDTVYVSSLWYQDCDPFVTVIGNSKETVQYVVDGLAQHRGRHKVHTGGVFAESMDTLQGFVCEHHSLAQVVDALESDGLFVC